MTAPCPYCRRASALYFRTQDYNRRLADTFFSYFRCQDCGLIFLDPLPADLAKFYPADYYGMPASLAELAGAAEFERYKIEQVQQFVTAGRLLEIGPAVGQFAYLAKQAGFEVDTIEMDAACCAFLREVVGVNALHEADAEAALERSEPYDVIALWHVIEHLPRPWATIAAAARCLRPGGILVLAAPNPDAWQFRLWKGRWTHVDAPRHVMLIPISFFAMHSEGLTPVWISTDEPGAHGWNTFGWRQSLSNLARHPRLKAVLRKIGTLATTLCAPLERSGRRGSTYTVVLRKAS